jgi:transketolase
MAAGLATLTRLGEAAVYDRLEDTSAALEDGLRAAAEATGGRILTVEDHWAEGGLGDAVLAALAENGETAQVVKLAVREMPRSGKPADLMSAYGIDADHIAAAASQLIGTQVAAS